jgi:hypothetical protein
MASLKSVMEWISNKSLRDKPAVSAVSVSASANPLQYDGQDAPARALYVAGEGDLTVTMQDGTSVTFGAATGFMPITVTHVTTIGSGITSVLALR